jgi:hypothetical protein
MLVKVFRIAEIEGWDAAHLSWLHTNDILEHFARKEYLRNIYIT